MTTSKKSWLWGLIVISFAIHILALWANMTWFKGMKWQHEPFHAAVEVTGACISLFVAYFLIKLRKNRPEQTIIYNILSGALIAMGVLDGFHAVVHVGQLFVWLHSMATFTGGLFFCFILFPLFNINRYDFRHFPLSALIGSTLFCLVSIFNQDWVPTMVVNKKFTLAAEWLNLLGGGFFIAAAFGLYQLNKSKADEDTFMFFLHTGLFGAAAIMFEQSQLWDVAWWGWHMLRVMAYGVALYFIARSFNEELYREKRDVEKMLHHNAKLSSIGQLAAGVGHEINNPLAIIKGYLTLIKRSQKIQDEKTLQSIEIIEKALSRIAKIVTGLRTFARAENDGEKEPFSLSELIKETQDMIEEIYHNQRINISFDYSTVKKHHGIKGDRGNLQQVLINLISNAKDATSEQEERIILVQAFVIEDKIVLKVKDNGPGIPHELLDKIYDPFFTTKPVGVGTGIGLSLVHKFVTRDFEGEINIETEESQGACFIITLPFTTLELKSPSEEPKKAPGPKLFSSCTVLIVDDEPFICESTGHILKNAGFNVLISRDGIEALKILKENQETIDIVISDIQMPRMGGVKLLKTLDEDPRLKIPHFIFMTGGIGEEYKAPEIQKLTSGHLLKPFSQVELLDLLSGLLKKEKTRNIA